MLRRGQAGFALRDLVMPAALLLLAGAAAGHYCKRHMKAERQSQMSRVTRELFDCEPDELMARAFTPERVQRAEEAAATRKVASAPPRGLRRAGSTKEKKTARPNSSRSTAPEKKRREAAPNRRRPAGAANGLAPTPRSAASVAPARRPQALADEYDRRCRAIMDEMY